MTSDGALKTCPSLDLRNKIFGANYKDTMRFLLLRCLV